MSQKRQLLNEKGWPCRVLMGKVFKCSRGRLPEGVERTEKVARDARSSSTGVKRPAPTIF